MKAVALICARGGSKGLPGKNIRPLAGLPLISWSIQHAQKVERVARVIVSTDSEEIAEVANAAGAEVPFIRPPELAADDTPEWLVWRHALDFLAGTQGESCEALLVVPPTAPLRHAADLDRCLDEYEKSGADVVITITNAHRSPYFNMVTRNNEGRVQLVMPPQERITRRQDAPAVFDITTVGYVAKPSFVSRHNGIFDGTVASVFIPPERASDIDSILDFRIAECLMQHDLASST